MGGRGVSRMGGVDAWLWRVGVVVGCMRWMGWVGWWGECGGWAVCMPHPTGKQGGWGGWLGVVDGNGGWVGGVGLVWRMGGCWGAGLFLTTLPANPIKHRFLALDHDLWEAPTKGIPSGIH